MVAIESNEPTEVSTGIFLDQPLRMHTMEFGAAKPKSILTRTKLLEVANARGIEPLLMPTMNFEIEEPDEPHCQSEGASQEVQH